MIDLTNNNKWYDYFTFLLSILTIVVTSHIRKDAKQAAKAAKILLSATCLLLPIKQKDKMPTLKKKMLECYNQWNHRPYLQVDVDVVSYGGGVKVEKECDEMSTEDNDLDIADIWLINAQKRFMYNVQVL